MREPCPFCGSQLIDHIEWVDANGCLLEYSQCSGCRSEIADADQINRNAQRSREKYPNANPRITKWMCDEIDRVALEDLKRRTLRIRLEEYAKTIPSANIESILESDRNSAGIEIPSWKKF